MSTEAHQWKVMLDAAAFVPTQPLDLTQFPADFVSISFYKMFGYPTGLGALLVCCRPPALPLFTRLYRVCMTFMGKRGHALHTVAGTNSALHPSRPPIFHTLLRHRLSQHVCTEKSDSSQPTNSHTGPHT